MKKRVITCICLCLIVCVGCSNSAHDDNTQTKQTEIQIENPTTEASPNISDRIYYKPDYAGKEIKDGCWNYNDALLVPMYDKLEVGVCDLYDFSKDAGVSLDKLNSVQGLSKNFIYGGGTAFYSDYRYKDSGVDYNDSLIWSSGAIYKDDRNKMDLDVLCVTLALYEMVEQEYSPVNVELYGYRGEKSYKELNELKGSSIDSLLEASESELVKLGEQYVKESGKVYINIWELKADYDNLVIVYRGEKEVGHLTRVIRQYGYSLVNKDKYLEWAECNNDRVIGLEKR